MNYWRTIMARLARLLVRIARSLDDLATGGHLTPAPAYMARLRQRYPDAPRHWLEAVAHRTVIDELPIEPVQQAETYEAPPWTADPAERPHDFTPSTRSAQPRTAFAAPVADRSRRVVVPRPQSQPRRSRAQIIVRAAHETVRSNPIFAIGRRHGLPRDVRFRTDNRSVAPDAATEPHIREFQTAPDRHDCSFPQLREARIVPEAMPLHENVVRQHAPAPQPEARLPGPRPEPHFPQPFSGARSDPPWPTAPRPAPHAMAPDFAMPLSNWPELPALADESHGRPLASPVDALRHEQVVGTWNA